MRIVALLAPVAALAAGLLGGLLMNQVRALPEPEGPSRLTAPLENTVVSTLPGPRSRRPGAAPMETSTGSRPNLGGVRQQPRHTGLSAGTFPALRSMHSVKTPPEIHAEAMALREDMNRFQLQARTLLRAGDLEGAERAALDAQAAIPVIHGVKESDDFIKLLLGDIRLYQGRYQDALHYYLPAIRHTMRFGLYGDIAFCYVRVGDYPNARRFYEKAVPEVMPDTKPEDLPGTMTPKTLEASILIARGMDASSSSRKAEALEYFEAAGRLAPENGLNAYWTAGALERQSRPDEAKAFWHRAAQYGRGKVADEAKRRVEQIQ